MRLEVASFLKSEVNEADAVVALLRLAAALRNAGFTVTVTPNGKFAIATGPSYDFHIEVVQ